MTDLRSSSKIALEMVEQKIIDAKRDVKDYERRGLDPPGWLLTRIKNLSGAAVALRQSKNEGER